MRRSALTLVVLVLAAAGLTVVTTPAGQAATLPAGFTDSLVGPVSAPTALAFTPDGRLLITTQAGRLFVARNGVIAASPALDISAKVCSNSERGLLGVAVDPAFATNNFVYLYYTAENSGGLCPSRAADSPVNRVVRVVLGANDVVNPASETVLFDRVLSFNGNHNAGDLAFGPDGKLYVSVGDGGCDYAASTNCGSANDAARDTHAALGKILRINTDGSTPADNPFAGTQNVCRDDGFTTPGQHCPETFAWGFRNPFRMAFAPDGRLLANDVGQGTWEEIDDVQAGADYGWNIREGFCATGSTTNCGTPPAGLTNPIHAYGHAATGCRSITGGAFVPDAVWPAEYRGDYLFADFVCGSIFRLEGTTRVDFVTGLGSGSATHLEFGPDNALYYTTFAGGGQVRKIAFDGTTPPPTSSVFVSDLTPVSATNGFGPVERDMTNGGMAAGDGQTITLNGTPYTKGLGTHAPSAVVYNLAGQYQAFSADVGVDDLCGSAGSVVFQVFVNGVKRFQTATMTGASPTRTVLVDTAGATQLKLVVTAAGDGAACDHADWANARLN